MVKVRSKTDRFRPDVPWCVLPKQALQREDVVLQQQYAMPSWRVDAIAPIVVCFVLY